MDVFGNVDETAKALFALKLAKGETPSEVFGGELDGLRYYPVDLGEPYWATEYGLIIPRREQPRWSCMDTDVELLYLNEIYLQIRLAVGAYGKLCEHSDYLRMQPLRYEDDDAALFARDSVEWDEALRSLYSFLTHWSLVSKILWPPKGAKSEVNAKEIRDLLGIGPKELEGRRLRNNLEHFDERMFDWVLVRDEYTWVSTSLSGGAGPGADTGGDLARRYDHGSGLMRFGDEIFDLKQMHEQLLRVSEKVNAERSRIIPLLRPDE